MKSDVLLLRRRLLSWYRRNRKDLPWRSRPDFYRTLVAEFMLQQTRTEQALPYFNRFIKVFPTLRRLAEASPQSVLKVWEGLGYYHRASRLHAAARTLFGRRVKFSDVEHLPGIGDYTRAAIGSIVFGLPMPVVDGNVKRVMSRVLALDLPPERKVADRALRDELDRWIPRKAPAAFNQAMMELGATLCRPRAPQCDRCPLAGCCQAFRKGNPEDYPKKRPGTAVPHREVAAAVIRRADGRILIAQRLATGLLPNLWEFPGGKRQRGESLKECCRREIREELSLGVDVGRKLSKVKHAYSHFTVTLHFYECKPTSGSPRARGCQDFKWARPRDLERYPFPRANWELVKELAKERP